MRGPSVATLTGLLTIALLLPGASGFAVHVDEPAPVAIPLGAPTPADFTPALREKVIAAGERGRAFDPDADVEVELATNFLFIRPGAWMWSPSWCTMNFIYGTAGNYEIGSAGHCNAVNTSVVLRVAHPLQGILYVSIGKTRLSNSNGVGDDWSITTINPWWQAYVDANVADIMGPQGGVYTGSAGLLAPKAVKHFGHGVGVGTGGTPRAGTMQSASATTVWFNSPSYQGDSGSPILLAGDAVNPLGQAVGILTHLVIVGNGASVIAGTRLGVVPATPVMGDGNPLPPA